MADWDKFRKEKDTMLKEDKINFLKSVVDDENEPHIVREAAAFKIVELM